MDWTNIARFSWRPGSHWCAQLGYAGVVPGGCQRSSAGHFLALCASAANARLAEAHCTEVSPGGRDSALSLERLDELLVQRTLPGTCAIFPVQSGGQCRR